MPVIATPELGQLDRVVCSERLNIAPSGKRFRADFLEPGIVNYDDVGLGNELLRKEVIEEALNSILQNPVTLGHISTKVHDFTGLSHGKVDAARWNGTTGWFECEGPLDTDEVRQAIPRKRCSIGFIVLEVGPAGRYHNVPYNRELTKIRFHHLAVVDNPRYEDSKIRLNAKQETPAMFKWIQKLREKIAGQTEEKVTEQTGELAPDASIEIDGQPVRMNELVGAHQAKVKADKDAADKKAKDEADAAARANAAPATLPADAEIEIDGQRVKVSDLVTTFKAGKSAEATARENAKQAADRKAAEDAKAKEEEDRRKAGAASFKVLASARANQVPAETSAASFNTASEQLARGASRYGAPAKN